MAVGAVDRAGVRYSQKRGEGVNSLYSNRSMMSVTEWWW